MKPRFADISRGLKVKIALVAILALGVAAGAGFSHHWVVFGQDHQRAERALPTPNDLSRAFIEVAKKVEPAVVNINVTRVNNRGEETNPEIPEGLQRLFPQLIPQQPQTERIGGSGVIISPDGYILTNNHVAGNGGEIYVTLADGTTRLKAKKVGNDPETDLAVIKVDGHNLPYATLGNSDAVQQGEWVVAIGSPFGLPQTMTAGIVSAVGRNLRGPTQTYDYYIQTDASINPGNSGGPLVDMDGKVIGINTLIYTNTGGSQGIGFAIPSSLASNIYAKLVKYGKVERGYLGVLLQAVSNGYAKSMGLQNANGALVADLPSTDTPAARAGLKSGDVIVEFDGKPVKSSRELIAMVADEPVGKIVPVKYIRDGQMETTTIKIAERQLQNGQVLGENGGETNPFDKLGISVQTLTPDMAQQGNYKIPTGAYVRDVKPGSPADEAGIQRGDVIHQVDRTRVLNAGDLSRALRQLGNAQDITLQVESGGQLGFVTITLQ